MLFSTIKVGFGTFSVYLSALHFFAFTRQKDERVKSLVAVFLRVSLEERFWEIIRVIIPVSRTLGVWIINSP